MMCYNRGDKGEMLMDKRYFMFNDQKVDVRDIGAIQIIYDEHGMSMAVDLVGKSAREQGGMIIVLNRYAVVL